VLIAGLTGNYGMGKSTVLEMFRRLGALTIGTDEIVDELLHDGSVLEKIRTFFGDSVFSKEGSLDRARIADIIFNDRAKRAVLEGILHPLVFQRIEDFVRQARQESPVERVVVVEIPLLFEKGYGGGFQRTITVHTDEETALNRLGEKGITRDRAAMRLAAQMPIQQKMRMADFAIDNSGTQEETEKQVKALYERLLGELGSSQ
jgi:dephospho-CoA kinase